jgi:hypothetical protein
MSVKITLFFDGKELVLRSGSRSYSYPARSGKIEGQTFKYDKRQQEKKDYGPIPEGEWYVVPDEWWERDFMTTGYNIIQGAPWTTLLDLEIDYHEANAITNEIQRHRDSWGNERLSIHPKASTKTYGRDGFFIHGGKDWGSIGCIDLTRYMPKFGRDFRRVTESIGGSTRIPLKVQYSASSVGKP